MPSSHAQGAQNRAEIAPGVHPSRFPPCRLCQLPEERYAAKSTNSVIHCRWFFVMKVERPSPTAQREENMDQWIPFFTAIAGIVLASIFTATNSWIQHRRERNTNRREIRRENLEKLYQIFEDIRSKYALLNIQLANVVNGISQPGEPISAGKFPYSEMDMVIGIYANTLRDSANEIYRLRDVHAQIFKDVMKIPLASNHSKDPHSLIDRCNQFELVLLDVITRAKETTAKLALECL